MLSQTENRVPRPLSSKYVFFFIVSFFIIIIYRWFIVMPTMLDRFPTGVAHLLLQYLFVFCSNSSCSQLTQDAVCTSCTLTICNEACSDSECFACSNSTGCRLCKTVCSECKSTVCPDCSYSCSACKKATCIYCPSPLPFLRHQESQELFCSICVRAAGADVCDYTVMH